MPKAPCSELSQTISDLALLHAQTPGMNTLDKIAERMQQDVPLITRERIAEAIVEANTWEPRAMSEAKKQVATIKREARQDKALREKIDQFEKHLTNATLPAKRRKGPLPPEAIQALQETYADLRKQVEASEPAKKERLQRSIDQLNDHLAEMSRPGWKPTPPPKPGRLSREVERMEFDRDQIRREIRGRLNELKPRSMWQVIQDPFNAARAIMTSLDLSAVLRQGGFVTFSNPLRSARAILPMIRAMSSEFQAHKIAKEIDDHPDRPLMDRAGLRLDDFASGSGRTSEEFQGRLAYKIPGVKQVVQMSARGHATFLNRIRVESFVAFSRTLARNGEPTLEEARAIANFVNVVTGKADLGSLERAATALNGIFFAPRYMASRFYILGGQPFWGKASRGSGLRFRALVAKEYAKALIGMGLVWALWQWATDEEVVFDPTDSKFLKLHVPGTNYYIDIAYGMSQTIRLFGRSGRSIKEVHEEGPAAFGVKDLKDIGTDFLHTKLAPLPAYGLELATRETAVGTETTPLESTTRLITPLSGSDVFNALKDFEMPESIAMGLTALLGAGLQNYEQDSPGGRRRRRERRRRRD